MSTFSIKDNSGTEAAMTLFLANGGEIKRVRTANKKDLIKANTKSKYLSRNGREDKVEENEHSLSISIFSRDERWGVK
jgi:hypothetical protein